MAQAGHNPEVSFLELLLSVEVASEWMGKWKAGS
jgi:hypothetical protein